MLYAIHDRVQPNPWWLGKHDDFTDFVWSDAVRSLGQDELHYMCE